MDKIINSKVNKQAIYEIYRACRLCGAGAGYKMPIIQNVLDIDGDEVELRQKIRECVQIEVYQDDKMPPLICELCVDKVNDFYEFMEMCRQTNKQTRRTLGLPLQNAKKGKMDTNDCILGVTEPVFVKKEKEEPRSSPRNTNNKNNQQKTSKNKKPQVKVEIKSKHSKEINNRVVRSRRVRSPSPRSTRRSRSSNEENISLSNLKNPPKKAKPLPPPPPPRSILKKTVQTEVSPQRPKRAREPPRHEIPQKKVKLSVKAGPGPGPEHRCGVCQQRHKTAQALASHLRCHAVYYTNPKLACNSCCEWFESVDGASAHHKWHRTAPAPYVCRGCREAYRTVQAYDQHVSGGCVPWLEAADVPCAACWRLFPTRALLHAHRCAGPHARPGGKCSKCNRTYALLKNLTKHESTCTVKRKLNYKIDPELLKHLKPLQIRVSKCDPLLKMSDSNHYDVSAVSEYYGLDSNSIYPYLRCRSLNLDSMVNIKSELDDFYCEEDYVHWDSDVSDDVSDEETERRVHSLSTLALKILFSQKCLGRVPRKRRRVKTEKSVFDSLINPVFDTEMSRNIDSIIDNLEVDDDNKNNDDTDTSTNIDNSDVGVGKNNNETDSSKNIDNSDVGVSKNNDGTDSSKNIDNSDVGVSKNNDGTDTSKNIDNSDVGVSKNNVETDSSKNIDSNIFSLDVGDDSKNNLETGNSKNIDNGDNGDKNSVFTDSRRNLDSTTNEDIDKKNKVDNVNKINDWLNNSNDGDAQNDVNNDTEGICTANASSLVDIENKINYHRNSNSDTTAETDTLQNNENNLLEDNKITESSDNQSNKDNVISENRTNQIDCSSLVGKVENVEDKMICNDSVSECVENNDSNVSNEDSIAKRVENESNDFKNEPLDVNEVTESSEVNAEESDTNELLEPINAANIEENDISLTKTIDERPTTDIDKDIEPESTKVDDKIESRSNWSNIKEKNAQNYINPPETVENIENVEDNTNKDTYESKNGLDEDSKTLNGDVDDRSDKLNMEDFNEEIDCDIDDKKLMADLDEHIGENNDTNVEDNGRDDDSMIRAKSGDNSNDKISLDDLIPNRSSDTKSMDLDSISDDDFNFD